GSALTSTPSTSSSRPRLCRTWLTRGTFAAGSRRTQLLGGTIPGRPRRRTCPWGINRAVLGLSTSTAVRRRTHSTERPIAVGSQRFFALSLPLLSGAVANDPQGTVLFPRARI